MPRLNMSASKSIFRTLLPCCRYVTHITPTTRIYPTTINHLLKQRYYSTEDSSTHTPEQKPTLVKNVLDAFLGLNESSSSEPKFGDDMKRTKSTRNEKRESKNNLIQRLIHVRRISKATGGGKKRSVHALVVVGDGNGSAGYGEGRALDATNAVQKALNQAQKNMVYIERFENRTLFSDMKHKFQSVNLDIKAERPGYGIVANNHIHEVCRCAGIHDIAVKIRGSTNPLNVVKAMFDALQSQNTPLDIARNRGRRAEDVYSTYYGFKST